MNTNTKFLAQQICSKYLDKKDYDKCILEYTVLSKKLPLLKYKECLICSKDKDKKDLDDMVLEDLANYINSFE